MSKYLPFISALFLLVSCNSKPVKLAKRSTDSSKTITKLAVSEKDSIKKYYTKDNEDTLIANRIIGMWAADSSENAAFDISKNTFYYPEHFKHYRYKIRKNSVIVDYKDYKDTFEVQIKGMDTLVLSNKDDGKSVFHRLKN